MRWATRAGVHIDRAACAWLIRRFVDAEAAFVFVTDPEDVPADATPFEMRGVELGHRHGGCTFETILRRYDLPGQVRSYGAKGAVIFHDRLAHYRDFLAYPDQWGNAHWLYQHNGGVFLPPWGKCEQWTVSVQHSVEDVQVFLANLERMAVDLSVKAGVRYRTVMSPSAARWKSC